MDQHRAGPTTDSPASARLVRASIEPRDTHRQMLDRPTKSSGLLGLTQNIGCRDIWTECLDVDARL